MYIYLNMRVDSYLKKIGGSKTRARLYKKPNPVDQSKTFAHHSPSTEGQRQGKTVIERHVKAVKEYQ